MIEVILATTRQEIKEAIEVREAILGPDDGGVPALEDEYDGDPTTVHCLVRDDEGGCIGAGRLVAPIDVESNGEMIVGNPTIGPIVVAEHARGQGIGRAILRFLEEEALTTYGHNGIVQVEAWISSGIADGANTIGYTIREEEAGAPLSSTRVFRDLSADDQGDSREGLTVA